MERAGIMLDFCKALADESRVKIAGLLSASERSVQDLAAVLGLKEPTVSHHLSILKKVGLVRMRVQGNTHWYRLNQDVLRRISREVFNRESLARLAGSVTAEASERKVLANFVVGDRLTDIPVARRKRWAVLKWLAGFFDQGVQYSEAQVNQILKAHHHDCATLRREMIGYRMLAREKGIYTRQGADRWRGPET